MIYRVYFEAIEGITRYWGDIEPLVRRSYGISEAVQLWQMPMTVRIVEFTDVDTLIQSSYDVPVNNDNTRGISLNGYLNDLGSQPRD